MSKQATSSQGLAASAWQRARDLQRSGPLAVVAAVVVFNLVLLRQEDSVVSTLNDSSFHELMVRYATAQFQLGHLPLDGWWPYLGLGSPLFLHYQSLGAMLTGLLGLAIGPDRAFSSTLYLLLSLWPICIYLSSRLLGLSRWQAAAAALVAPFLQSVTAVGYEQQSYLWVGFGVWSQLFGMWTLPLAWGLTARAIRTGRGLIAAFVLITLTIASHFMTGYLTVLPLVLLPLACPSEIRLRLKRSILIALGALLTSAWVTIPLWRFGKWTALNEFLQGSPDSDSYGARQVLTWLADGSLFDSGHLLPVITVLGGVGLALALWHWRSAEVSRVIALLFGVSLVLFFGRPTLGPLWDLVPGHRDLFLRRFLMGVQLSGIYLAGIGICALVSALRGVVTRHAGRLLTERLWRLAAGTALVALVLTVLAPAWSAVASQDLRDGGDIRLQMGYDATQGQEVNTLVAQANLLGPGRFFAGMPNDVWGPQFTVGYVPVFKYLANLDVDIVGYTLRTSSLMTDPEAYFDEYEPGDYPLFGVRYLLLPVSRQPSVAAQLVSKVGPYALWELPQVGYLRVVDTSGSISADRTNIGARTAQFVRSSLPLTGPYPVIAYAGGAPPPTTLTGSTPPSGQAGTVTSSTVNLAEGEVSGTVDAQRTAVVAVSVSYDPGWTARVDGVPAPTVMLAPAIVGVMVPVGVHQVEFRYRPPSYYPELFALALLAIFAFALVPPLRRRAGRRES